MKEQRWTLIIAILSLERPRIRPRGFSATTFPEINTFFKYEHLLFINEFEELKTIICRLSLSNFIPL